MLKKICILVTTMMLVCFGVACTQETANQSNGKLQITTTTGQIADITEQIGQEKVVVTPLMGAGVDPHLYQASQGDIQKLRKADIIFYNGLHLEGKMGDVLEKMEKDKPTVAVTSSMPKNELISSSGDANAYDPHVWFDISLWQHAVAVVRDTLIKQDPDNKVFYEENATVYLKQLDELQVYAQQRIAEIPEKSRVLITAHDAFHYFGAAYKIEVKGLQGLSTDSEYGLKDVQALIDTIVDRNIKAVFIETSISDKSIKAVVEGAKKKGHTVVVGGELFSDAMGKKGTNTGTYIGMYKHNVDTIVEALK
ncbi:zinc ABC transporter substrate-binding protein [Ectobacillus sp. JY-23]|uniref:metal ABC transporter solute-binding protein, Zn/Mn family n=1 Tax=Ectobacillus sp. JY-23 TaxID=2933872 RepID=UPI001FF47F77|nr:zinc ABC transporter substrate-binding protein [Ectobacillus sp. JY-23]UOY93461.1 zinc ABC transporter substrate-binding protein [Ectobacillus sp. JY-23]